MSARARWRPTPLIAGSLGLHAAAPVALLAAPAAWPWVLGGLVANHMLLTACGLWPRSTWLGPNLLRLPDAAAARGEIAITLDDGPDPAVTPQVLRILAEHGARATFFCIGERVLAHPALAREIVAHGHTIENHSQRHRHTFSFLGMGGFRRELAAAQASIAQVTGRAPRFVRAPAGLRNPLFDPVLPGLGLRLASWTRRGFDTASGDAERVFHRLTRGLTAGDILLLHDGHAARTADGRPVVLAVLPRLLQTAAAAGLKPVTLDAAIPAE